MKDGAIRILDVPLPVLGPGAVRVQNHFWAGALTTVRVCQGAGGTLDTIAGTVRRAPPAWCRLNLDWLYRLLAEPKRIRRQRVLPLFALQVAARALARRAT